VDDDRGTREGLAALIGGTRGFRCVGVYGSVEGAQPRPGDPAPDVLLLDIHLPGLRIPAEEDAARAPVVVALQRQRRIDKPEEALTPHDMRILGMLADGDSNQDVGDRVGITVNTVHNYVRRICEKLHVRYQIRGRQQGAPRPADSLSRGFPRRRRAPSLGAS
jgi:DNA-binding NarL/FixJ family response regulator